METCPVSLEKSYYELQIKINPEIEEVLSDFFFENFSCEGVLLEEETYKDLEMISSTRGTLRVFLSSVPDNLDEIINNERILLKARGFNENDLGSYILANKPNEDWSKKWKEKWDITSVSDRIVIVPDWLEYSPKGAEVVIRLEPGCAFGTGTHQTTQLCMIAIEKYLKSNDNMADIGTGSGILAICAKKFGAEYVYGCDNDPTVIDVAKENSVKNNVDCEFELNTADKLNKKFNFICANILHNILAEIMPDLKNIMENNAIMVLSGILDEKKGIVIDAIKKYNLTLIEEMHKDQWVALIVKKEKND